MFGVLKVDNFFNFTLDLPVFIPTLPGVELFQQRIAILVLLSDIIWLIKKKQP